MEMGRSYAYREKRGPDVPMLKVKLLDKVGRKGKIKVRFEDGPHPGLRSTSRLGRLSAAGASARPSSATSSERPTRGVHGQDVRQGALRGGVCGAREHRRARGIR